MLEIVISIVATAIVSVIIARWQMKKNQIDHYYINSYDIGKGLTDVFPDFSLHYGNEVLSKNVKVLKGGFINIGRNDIGEVEKKIDIKIILPEGCVVKDVKVLPLEDGLNVEWIKKKKGINKPVSIETKPEENNNEVVFEIEGLFKAKECFEYSSIIEVPDSHMDIDKLMVLSHRIKDTMFEKIYLGREYTEYTKMNPRRLMNWFFVGIGVVSILVWIGVQLFGDYELQNGSEAIMICGFLYEVVGIAGLVGDRWGKKGRVIHELLRQ